MDKYTLRQNIADYTCKHFFNGKPSLKGKIIKDLGTLDSDILMDFYIILKDQKNYILDELRRMDTKNSFKVSYGRFRYLYGMVQRLIKESNQQKEPPAPQPKSEYRPSRMDELIADSQLPTKASAKDKPAISDSDLFETAPDAIHEVWAKLDESERRKNWGKAIAEHRQQRKPEYTPDEMY